MSKRPIAYMPQLEWFLAGLISIAILAVIILGGYA
jgi:hypothetical protein